MTECVEPATGTYLRGVKGSLFLRHTALTGSHCVLISSFSPPLSLSFQLQLLYCPCFYHQPERCLHDADGMTLPALPGLLWPRLMVSGLLESPAYGASPVLASVAPVAAPPCATSSCSLPLAPLDMLASQVCSGATLVVPLSSWPCSVALSLCRGDLIGLSSSCTF